MNNLQGPLTLIVIKKYYAYSGHRQISNGLRTSALFIVDMLCAEGFNAKLAEAVDGNSIDALVHQNKPARVILEAIWATPAKLEELIRLHPSVRWTVRVHSELPFLSNEGMAVEWLAAYMNLGVEVAFNSKQTARDFSLLGQTAYLPNYYPLTERLPYRERYKGHLDVGCFGAIRPLKNQLTQAFAAVRYAESIRKPLVFHMNGSRVEQEGSNNLKNIEALMKAAGQSLILHPWLEHREFCDLLGSMDICLQVSLSETFCIVAADAVNACVSLVGSDAIPWLPKISRARADSVESICVAMAQDTIAGNHCALAEYIYQSVRDWNKWMEN